MVQVAFYYLGRSKNHKTIVLNSKCKDHKARIDYTKRLKTKQIHEIIGVCQTLALYGISQNRVWVLRSL